jgi:beta-galactosidase
VTSEKQDFCLNWEFVKSAAEWPDDFAQEGNSMEPVHLPHTWNANDMVWDETDAYDPYVGSGWYRKVFNAPELNPGQRLLLEFEGATNCFKVWVNDGYAGGRNGGFLPTQMDITDFLEDGNNTILVRVDNSYNLAAAMPRNIDWNRYGGITRPVWMRVREHAYLACPGIETRTPQVSVDEATTTARTHIEETDLQGSSLDVRHTLLKPDGEILSVTTRGISTRFGRTNTAEVELPTVAQPQLWSDAAPTLYTLRTELLEKGRVVDSSEDRIGYRFCEFNADKGFLLNGKPTELRGANIHIFFPGLGNAVPERFHRSDMELMKRMGCNFMRTSHYPRPRACLDACDELGILVLEEQPYWHGSIRATGGENAVDNAPRLIRDMVKHHGSHPCIIAWNTVNEVMLAPFYKPGVGHLEPNDPRRAAWQINPKEYPYIRRHLQKMVDTFKEVDPDRPVSVVVGGRWEKNDEAGLTSIADIVAYNGGAMNFTEDFIGPKDGKPYAFRPDYYRAIYPRRVHLMSEGILNDICFERGDWEKEETAWLNNAKYWNAFGARPWFCGGSMWCFTDYSANGMIRYHGAVDQHRLPKDLFYFYAAMWSDRPVLHILGHWNHEAGDIRDVVVFTNCIDVELSLNGKSLGQGTSCSDDYPHLANPTLVWEAIPFEKGTLTAQGKHGEEVLEDIRITAGTPANVQIDCSNDTILADGRDIAYVDLTVCDADGNRCYTSDEALVVTVDGSASLAGPSTVRAPGGLARVAIRSTGVRGPVTVTACGKEPTLLKASTKATLHSEFE